MNIVLYLAEAFLVAYAMRIVSLRLKIPTVSGYVVGGVLLGGTLFIWLPGAGRLVERWLFSEKALEQLLFINHIALGTISLAIGTELEWKHIRHIGKSIASIAFFEAIGAFLLVTAVTWFVTRDFPLAFVLGAVSSATAPAATVAVIQQYHARGPLTNTILAVVGIDDAISFFIFAFALAVAKSNIRGEHIDIVNGVLRPVLEIGVSVLIGATIGFIGARLLMSAKDHDSALFILAAVILWVSGVSSAAGVSELIANMASGVVIVNTYPQLKNKIRSIFSAFMPMLYALFFIIGGAHLDLSSLPSIWLIAIVYFIARASGKIAGAYSGASLSKSLPQVRKYVGLSLLPQVGAAVGLALVVQEEFGKGAYGAEGANLAHITMNVLLVTTLMTEFIGPYLMKNALIKAGEAGE